MKNKEKKETRLDILMKEMKPVLKKEKYIYMSLSKSNFMKINIDDILFFFKEDEGYTVVMEKNKNILEFDYDNEWALITLQVNSSLNAIGFTAAFSNILKQNLISCNVIAGYYHDHILVDFKDGKKALESLIKNK